MRNILKKSFLCRFHWQPYMYLFVKGKWKWIQSFLLCCPIPNKYFICQSFRNGSSLYAVFVGFNNGSCLHHIAMVFYFPRYLQWFVSLHNRSWLFALFRMIHGVSYGHYSFTIVHCFQKFSRCILPKKIMLLIIAIAIIYSASYTHLFVYPLHCPIQQNQTNEPIC